MSYLSNINENVSEARETEKSTVIDNEGQDDFEVKRRALRERNYGGSKVETPKIQSLMQKSNAQIKKSVSSRKYNQQILIKIFKSK